MIFLMQNNLIQIIYTEIQDLPFIIESEHRTENAQYIGQWSVEQHKNALHDDDILHLLIRNTEGKNIGYAIIKGLINRNDSIELMRIVINDKGGGYGKAALYLIKKWCCEIQNAHRLWLDVRENNLTAQHVYKTQGFIIEGVLRECVKVGDSYQSLIVMSILSQDYFC